MITPQPTQRAISVAGVNGIFRWHIGITYVDMWAPCPALREEYSSRASTYLVNKSETINKLITF